MEIIVRTLRSSHDSIKVIKDGNWYWWEWETKPGNGYIYPNLHAALLGVFEALNNLIDGVHKDGRH